MPNQKLTYKQIVHKIIYDSGYAKQIADLIVRARQNPPDQEAIAQLEQIFDPRDDELTEINLSKDALSCVQGSPNPQLFQTTPTKFMLLDFSRMYR